MTDAEKIAMFDKIQRMLWRMAMEGNVLQSIVAAAIIREAAVQGPNGEDPEEA